MKVLLLDGYNLIYRAHYGFGKGEFATVYCFFRGLRVLVEKFNPDKIYFVLEGYPKKRMAMFEEYKATRKQLDPEDSFHMQKRRIISLLKDCFPIDVVRHPDYECDDVLANLVKYTHKDDDCVVISSDTDFFQLYNTCPNVKIYNPVRKKIIPKFDYDYVKWKALRGDSCDNIEGFRGIGDKRAMALVENDEKLESFLSADPANRELFNRNCKLIQFHDLVYEMDELEHSLTTADWEQLKKCFNIMSFYSITNDKSWKKFTSTFTSSEPMITVNGEV
tara:strand:- start:269 stop:1099 length:831 start_codon:yes stop_codon:yes gene_type:complete